MTDREYQIYQGGGYLSSSFRKSKVLRKYVRKHHADECFLIQIRDYLPFAPFFLPRHCHLSGILYRIYYYDWPKLDLMRKMKEVLEISVLSLSPSVKKVYMLNAPAAAAYTNRRFHTAKYAYLPDPIHIEEAEAVDIRAEFKIPAGECVFLHFGTLTVRKGTMTIMKALEGMSDEELRRHTYIFAGQIYNDLHDDFYAAKEPLVQRGAKIIVFEEFCSYHFLECLVKSSDVILIPYQNVAFSSGIMGYAARFQVPVIGPAEGLLGKLIRKYRLGKTIENINPRQLREAILEGPFAIASNEQYVSDNTAAHFTRIIFGHLLRG